MFLFVFFIHVVVGTNTLVFACYFYLFFNSFCLLFTQFVKGELIGGGEAPLAQAESEPGLREEPQSGRKLVVGACHWGWRPTQGVGCEPHIRSARLILYLFCTRWGTERPHGGPEDPTLSLMPILSTREKDPPHF